MSYTNHTDNYNLPQWIGTDKPTFLGDFNTAFGIIDAAIKDASDAASSAVSTANSAADAASTASTNATTALTTANTAKDTADAASTAAGTAVTKADAALTASQGAQTAAAANTITNLAPAYDPTLTYDVDDLVTFIDAQGSGKLYKCIVAVTVPEEFNINKWDDVTTSEVYSRKEVLIDTYTGTTSNTIGDMLNALITGKNFTNYKDLTLKCKNTVSHSEITYKSAYIENKSTRFGVVNISTSANILITLGCFTDDNVYSYVTRIMFSDGSVTNTNNINDTINDGDVWYLYGTI